MNENFSNAFSIDSHWCGRGGCVSESHHTSKKRKDPAWNVAYLQNSLGQLVVVNTNNNKQEENGSFEERVSKANKQ